MASFKLAQTLMPKQLKGVVARRCFTSVGNGIIGLQSRRYVLGTSSDHQQRIRGWSQRPRRSIHQHTVPSRVATGQSAPPTRCYSMQHEPLGFIESEEEAQSIIGEVGPLVRDIDTLRDEAEKAEQPIKGPRSGIEYSVAYAYACLRDLTNEVVNVVCKGPLEKNRGGGESLSYVVRSFKDALDGNEEAVKKLGQLQEQYTEYAGKMSSLVGRLGAAERFLVDRVKTEKNLLGLANTQYSQACRDLHEVKSDISRLQYEIDRNKQHQKALGWIPVAGSFIVVGLELDIKAKKAQWMVLEEQVGGLQKTMDRHSDKVDEIGSSIKNLTLLSGQLLSRQELLQHVSTSNCYVKDAVLRAKHSLVESHNNLADINASAQIAFEPSLCLSYCQTILRIVLLLPNVMDPNNHQDDLQRIVIANDTCMSMEKLPQRLLTEEEDPLDYGSEDKSLGVLLKEARGFLRSRLTTFEQNISGNAEAVLHSCGYNQRSWLAEKQSIMGTD